MSSACQSTRGFLRLQNNSLSKHPREKGLSVQGCRTAQYSYIWSTFSYLDEVFCSRKWNGAVSLQVLVKKSSDSRLVQYQRFITPTKLRKSTEEENSGADETWLFLGSVFSLSFPSVCYLKLSPCMFSWPCFPYLCTWRMFWARWKQQVLVTWAVCAEISDPAVNSW